MIKLQPKANWKEVRRDHIGRWFVWGDLKVCVGDPEQEGHHHISISHPYRYPTWDEIYTARYDFCPHDIDMAIILPKKTEYAVVARFNEELGAPDSGECAKRDDSGDCIDRLFQCPSGPDNERPRYEEFRSAMCPRCELRLAMLDKRKVARAQLGAHKRGLLKIGRRLLGATGGK